MRAVIDTDVLVSALFSRTRSGNGKGVKRSIQWIDRSPNAVIVRRLTRPSATVPLTVGALLLEQNDEWALARRYMSLESLARIVDNPVTSLPAAGT